MSVPWYGAGIVSFQLRARCAACGGRIPILISDDIDDVNANELTLGCFVAPLVVQQREVLVVAHNIDFLVRAAIPNDVAWHLSHADSASGAFRAPIDVVGRAGLMANTEGHAKCDLRLRELQ